ncbi:MAG: sugar phosphate isomerase/epimerase family protein [Chloroflexota bacterium]
MSRAVNGTSQVPLSISTMWGIGRFADMGEFVRAAKSLGFSRFELNHQVTPLLLAQIRDLYAGGQMVISSVHDPCPTPDDRPGFENPPQLSSLVESERRLAVDIALGTLDLAHQLQARAIVVHAGRVEIDLASEWRLRELHAQGLANAITYHETKEHLRRQREAQKGPHLEAVLHSLRTLQKHAASLGLRIGLENRYHYYEIPTADDLAWLLDELDPDVVGYWHDTGHAQVLENLGFGHHREWLKRFSRRIIGVHLHDVRGTHDHLATVGLGIDFATTRRFIPETAIRVCEFAPSNEPNEVVAGLAHLCQLGYC